MSPRIAGILPIVHLPLTGDDQVDLVVLRRQIDWAFSQGASGVGTGMVTETLKMTFAERSRLTPVLVEMANGRGPVFMSVGAESTAQALEYARLAAAAGCDAIMAAPPVASRVSRAELAGYFRALADAVDVPLIVQDASGYVGQSIPIDLCVELLDRYGADKILFKPEASPTGPQLSALRDASDGRARILEGSGGILLIDSYRRGIVGTMPGMELLDGISAIWRALQAGDEETAYRVALPLSAIVFLQIQAGLDGFLAIEKYLLCKRGIFANERRRPPYAWELDAETAAEVDRLYARLHLAVTAAPP